ncbi:MAG: His/Gly/Thr/Pro-type tRNA ligase C-terminal domain-containing protein, partial [Bacteroidota bacterium]
RDWINSYRDLPLLINQWANVVRWELRTRLFLRTAEFLWQEGHTAHATREEAVEETLTILDVYAKFAEEFMAMPVIKGVKTANERFAGAEDTYTIEALMQDGKALQAGTSHFLGQNFAKAFDVKFSSKENKEEYVWATSWGVSTRLMGGLIMTHSDDDGLIVPPRLATFQVVIVPIPKPNEEIDVVANQIMTDLRAKGIRVSYDNDPTKRPGFKFAENELKGIPIRLGIGKRDLEKGVIEVARRDTKEKSSQPLEGIAEHVAQLLEEIQQNLFQKALDFRNERITKVDSWDEFTQVLDDKGGFVLAHWDGTTETEVKIKELSKATIRCIPLDQELEAGTCVLTGAPSKQRVLFARAY